MKKAVQFDPKSEKEDYYFIDLRDYVSIVAETSDGLIPLVRQFRPAVETYTLELPAGLVEPGETPEQCCRRELKEETGLDALEICPLGAYYPDTGRMLNCQHAFYVKASSRPKRFVSEHGMSVDFVDFDGLKGLICSGEFKHQLHIGVVMLYDLYVRGKLKAAR